MGRGRTGGQPAPSQPSRPRCCDQSPCETELRARRAAATMGKAATSPRAELQNHCCQSDSGPQRTSISVDRNSSTLNAGTCATRHLPGCQRNWAKGFNRVGHNGFLLTCQPEQAEELFSLFEPLLKFISNRLRHLRTAPSARCDTVSKLQAYLSCSCRGWAAGDGSRHFAYAWFPETVLRVLCCHIRSEEDAVNGSILSKRAVYCLLLYSLFKVLLNYRCKEDTEAWKRPPSLYSLPSRAGRKALRSLELSFTSLS